MLRALVENGGDLNRRFRLWRYQNVNALHLAAASDSVETIRFLLEQGLDVNEPEFGDELSMTPLTVAMQRIFHRKSEKDVVAASLDVVRVLLEAGADPNFEVLPGDSALQLAEQSKIEPLIELLSQPRLAKPYHESGRLSPKE